MTVVTICFMLDGYLLLLIISTFLSDFLIFGLALSIVIVSLITLQTSKLRGFYVVASLIVPILADFSFGYLRLYCGIASASFHTQLISLGIHV